MGQNALIDVFYNKFRKVLGVKVMATGTVKWFNSQKGFGFIVPNDGSSELFVHHTDIQMEGFKSLSDGQAVEFEIGEGKKGPCAQSVKPC